jgi:hypothetical protein
MLITAFAFLDAIDFERRCEADEVEVEVEVEVEGRYI